MRSWHEMWSKQSTMIAGQLVNAKMGIFGPKITYSLHCSSRVRAMVVAIIHSYSIISIDLYAILLLYLMIGYIV